MSKEVMQMALIVLEIYGAQAPDVNETIEILRTALAQPEKEWVGLTKEEAFDLLVKHKDKPFSLSAAVENLLREKNHG